ncbi:MAG: DNRLRE domain-containing protein [Bacteroidota bacterium]
MRISLIKIFWIISISLTLLISCSEDPSSIGIELLPEKDFIETLTINSIEAAFEQQSRSYTDSLKLNSSNILLFGKHDNVQSTMLLKFLVFLPDSIKQAVLDETLEVLSSQIDLRIVYTYGDKNNSFDFSVNKINSSWNSLSFNKDSLASLDYENIDRSTNKVYSDTSITFDFDKELVRDWLNYSVAEEQAENNNGIYFNYTSGSEKILGFPAISYPNEELLGKLTIIVQVPDEFIDTIIVSTTSDVHAVLGDLPSGNPENIFIQGGIAVRSNILIDVSKIPDNTIINKATLKLYYDESESLIGTKISDSLGVIGLSDFDQNEINESLPPTLLKREENFYSGDITRFVQDWVSKQENGGLQLFLANEITTVNKVSLKGSTASDINMKPYLEIIYTIKD